MLSGVASTGVSINRLLAATGGHGVSGVRSARPGQQSESAEQINAADPLGKTELTEEEKQQVEKLKQRDAEVRRHEQAHKAAAGGHAAGGPTFEFQTGPDGKRYAVGGEVQIDTSEVQGDPQATIAKMQQIRRAANAPAEPSAQDRKVAAQAAQAEQKARRELAEQRAEKTRGGGDEPRQSSETTVETNRVDSNATQSDSFIATDRNQPRQGLAETLGSQTATPSTATISTVLASSTRADERFEPFSQSVGRFIDARV